MLAASLTESACAGRAGVPMEVMGLMLGEFVDDYTVRLRFHISQCCFVPCLTPRGHLPRPALYGHHFYLTILPTPCTKVLKLQQRFCALCQCTASNSLHAGDAAG